MYVDTSISSSPSRLRFLAEAVRVMLGGEISIDDFRRCGREEDAVSWIFEWRDDELGTACGTVGDNGASVVNNEEIDIAPLRGVVIAY